MEKKRMNLILTQKEPLIAGNTTYYPADDFRLTKFDLEIARQKISETDETKIKSLRKLKDMISRDASVVYCTDDDFLLRYLRVSNYECEKAHKAMKKFYTMKKKNPELLVISPNLEKFLEQNFLRRIPYRDEDGCVLFWIKASNWKLEEMSFDNIMQVCFPTLDFISMNPCMQINGVIYIIDCKDLTASQIAQILYPSHLLLLSQCLQEIYPWRVKRVILINSSSLVPMLYKIVRPFLKKKIADRIIILGSDLTELHKYVNPCLLPREYGGSIDEKDCSITRSVLDNLHYVKYQRTFGAVMEK